MISKNANLGEKYGPAMKIECQHKADKYFQELVKHCMSFGRIREEAEEIERSNLGYYAGYYNSDTRARVERLFKCSHPVFGSASEGSPTCEEAFEMGKQMGQLTKEGKTVAAATKIVRGEKDVLKRSGHNRQGGKM